MNFMSFIWRLYVYGYIYRYIHFRKIKEEEDLEKGIRGTKGIKGVRDTFRDIDERISKNISID